MWNTTKNTKKTLIIGIMILMGQISTLAQSAYAYGKNDSIVVPYAIGMNQEPKKSGWEKPIDNGDGTATYKKALFPINVGPKGGRYILYNGKKIYLKKSA